MVKKVAETIAQAVKILDVHGLEHARVKKALINLKAKYPKGTLLRIIIKEHAYRSGAHVALPLVKTALKDQDIAWRYAKLEDGGDGVIECVIE